MSEIIGFGFQDDNDEKLQSKSGGKFGLNQGAKLTKFEYNPNAGANNTQGDAIDITVKIGEREYRKRVFPTDRVWNKDGEITDKSSEEYKKAYNADWIQKSALITHILKAFRTEEDIKKALSSPLSSFSEWAAVVQGLLPNGFETKSIDVFLEYQHEIKEGQNRTYPEIPKNMKGGYWICPAQEGIFKEVRDNEGGIKYVNSSNLEHTFFRNSNFMESTKGKQQIEGEENSSTGSAIDSGTVTSPTSSGWN